MCVISFQRGRESSIYNHPRSFTALWARKRRPGRYAGLTSRRFVLCQWAYEACSPFSQAMKQIGFDVAETQGSSVRFDPPAKQARSITFHRVSIVASTLRGPSTLRPLATSGRQPRATRHQMVRDTSFPPTWLDGVDRLSLRFGARLKRCYGWSVDTFLEELPREEQRLSAVYGLCTNVS